MISTATKIFTVSELIYDAKASLEGMYPAVWVQGEISNLNCHSSGHCYFSLKDAGAQLSGVMFRDDFRRLRFKPENGMQVLLKGRLTVYPPQGRFQMVSTEMEPQGKGGLQLAFEQLKAKLEKEGLFAAERKRPIPALPQWIGIITSQDGAAMHDMLTVLERRHVGLRLLICPTKVQGEGAARDIADSIRRLNEDYPEIDVLLVGRGGGSLEDLWAFNEEATARAIAASKIPVISCVGHETDFTIADFVADLRAPTPSAAAELVSQAKSELLDQLRSHVSHLTNYMTYRLNDLEQKLGHALSSPMLKRPTALIDELLQDVDALRERLLQIAQHRLDGWTKDFALLSEKLNLLSPLATLSRGYAIAWKLPEKKILKDASSLKPHDQIEVQLRGGKIYAEVKRTEV
jgi:exodeoxyribonuclease VII large subunit